MYDLILAIDNSFGLSRRGDLPWRKTPIGLADMKWFAETTTGGVVVMGRTTWETLPSPLAKRVNVVVSRTLKESPGAVVYSDLSEALEWAQQQNKPVYVVGGNDIYQQTMVGARYVMVTMIGNDYECDVKLAREVYCRLQIIDSKNLTYGIYNFPGAVKICIPLKEIPTDPDLVSLVDSREFRTNYNSEGEDSYLTLLEKLLNRRPKHSRPGINTLSAFGTMLKLDISGDVIPALTTKYVALKSVIVELLWMIRGDGNTKYLEERGVNIWKINTRRAFLDARGLKDVPEGHIGEGYPKHWRHWGEENVDQLLNLIKGVVSDPHGRRHLMLSWHPGRNHLAALPPCHYSLELYVNSDDQLEGMVTMRSSDVPLGLPFNITSYAILLHLIAAMTGRKAVRLCFSLGDHHIYVNQLAGVKEQLDRVPCSKFPTLALKDKLAQHLSSGVDAALEYLTTQAEYTDFIVTDYYCQPPIEMPMAE